MKKKLTIKEPLVAMKEKYKDKYREYSIFRGGIKWYRRIKTTKIGQDLIIDIGEDIDKVILNGKVINEKKS